MVEPRIVPREEHPISRRDIDPDALKVLYRLRQADFTAYLVGGSVRDLLLARRPKDFDIGTSAHPYQVKKLFRNCWIIGRRFRLAHVKFGTKVIEVATFRRQVQPGEEITPDAAHDSAVHHDNTLFYDIATFSIIDYVNGMDDLHAGIVRSIGDPEVRFQEDPVRMLRAVALAARLNFTLDPPVRDAIKQLRHEIARSSPARLLEEYYKILRAGSAEKTFRGLADAGLLEPISEELHRGATEALWRSLAAVDTYRQKFAAAPETLTNPVLLGSFLVPLGLSPQMGRPAYVESASGKKRPAIPRMGSLPLARRDVERLRQILGLQRRLRDLGASVRAQRALTHRGIFRDGLTWLEVHGDAPDLVEHWITVLAERGAEEPVLAAGEVSEMVPFQRRRRRRRRRRGHRVPNS